MKTSVIVRTLCIKVVKALLLQPLGWIHLLTINSAVHVTAEYERVVLPKSHVDTNPGSQQITFPNKHFELVATKKL